MGFRLVHYTVMSNHMHMLVEAPDAKRLSRGMQGLMIRMARALNRSWARTGKVFGDRYHARVLRVPRQVRNTVLYVINNARRHGVQLDPKRPDPCSSGRWFNGWRDFAKEHFTGVIPVVEAGTWLLSVGWRKHGLLGVANVPGR